MDATLPRVRGPAKLPLPIPGRSPTWSRLEPPLRRSRSPFAAPGHAVRAPLAVLALAVALAAGALTIWLEESTKDFEANFDISIGGILLPLVLFILARVFRRGAEMREELEGTV